MIHKLQNKVLWPALGAVLLGFTLAGCGGDTAGETATAPAATNSTQTANDGHAHAPGEAPHAHKGEKAGAHGADNHDAEIEAAIAKFFPGATLAKKPFPFDAAAASHLSEQAGVKFSGTEGKWQVYEATKEGQRVGLAVMTHSALPDGKDMHLTFAVNREFKITHVTAVDAPDNAKMQSFAKQMIGKTYDAAFKVGKDLKAPAGLSPQIAQIAADAVHKGIMILEENFNPLHSDHEHKGGHEHSDGSAHKEGDGHKH